MLVGGSPPGGNSETQAASLLQLHHLLPSLQLPGEESQGVEMTLDCIGLKRHERFHLHFDWQECSHVVSAEPQRRLGNVISCVPRNRKQWGEQIALFLPYCISSNANTGFQFNQKL